MDLVRLACVRHAASVRPEPGSNSPSRSQVLHRGGSPSIGLKSRQIPGAEAPVCCRLAPEQPAILLSVSSAFILERLRDPPRRAGQSPALAVSSSLLFSRSVVRPRWGQRSTGSRSLKWCGGAGVALPVASAVPRPPWGGGTTYRRDPGKCQLPGRRSTTAQPFFPLRSSTQRSWRTSDASSRRSGGRLLAVHRHAALLELAPGIALRRRQPGPLEHRAERHAGAEVLARPRAGPPAPRGPPRPAPPGTPGGDRPPKRISLASSAAWRASAPWTRSVTSRASARWATRRPGSAACSSTSARDLGHRAAA